MKKAVKDVINEKEPIGPNLEEINYSFKKKDKHSKKNYKKINNIISIIILILLIILFVVLHLITPQIALNGENEIEINYNETYIEKGAKANFFNADISKEIEITNNIDTTKIGSYEVLYKLNHNGFEIKKTRTVKVVDKKSPTINLEGESEVKICPNTKFKEIGYEALDEYDGNITDKVKVEIKKDLVLYSVEDKSGNSYEITRKLIETDDEKPTIDLKGNKTMYLNLTEAFTEPGYTATDNCSGDLTNKVTVTGEVINYQKGTYILKYQVSDDKGNKTTVERKIVISEKTDPNSGITKKGAIYLTFDDGPSSVTTGEILDILKEEGVKATFFVTNSGPDYLIKRIYNEGHTLALHTASHNYAKVYSSVDNYFKDLKQVSDRVERLTGHTSKIVRFPGGSSNTISRRYCKGIMTTLSQELFSRGYRYYDWNVDSHDASNARTKQAVYNNVTRNLSKNRANIVLMHDIKVPTRDAIRDIIRYGKENGYTFERIDMDTYMIRQKIAN